MCANCTKTFGGLPDQVVAERDRLAATIDRVRALAVEWETTGGLAGAVAAERLHAAISGQTHPVDEGLYPCPCSHPPTWAACEAAGCTCHRVVTFAERR